MSRHKRSGRPQSSPCKRTSRPRLEVLESRLVLSTPATISGTVFLDLHVTGTIAAGDPGLAGRTVFVDLHNDGVQHSDDPSAVTDASGHYAITGVNPGATLQVVTYPGDNPTTPTAVVINSNSSTEDFGLQPESTVFPTVPSHDPFAGGGNAIVQSLYHNILGRDGDPGGLALWDARLKAGVSVDQVAGQFYQSPEYLTNVVKSYYQTYLGRAGDQSGIAIWVAKLEAGASQQEIATDFLSSPEYSTKHVTDVDFVQSLYVNILGRAGDQAEIDLWKQLLGAGTSRATVAADFIGSTESSLRVIDGDYTALLARVGDTSGVNFWLAQVQNGSTLPEVAADFFGSPEYTILASQETAPATQLVLTTMPPSSVTAGQSFGLAVTAENQNGFVDTTYTGPVTLALSSGTAGAVLGGTLTVNAVNGVATFSGLTIDKAGTGYTLTASSGTLKSTTNSINVAATLTVSGITASNRGYDGNTDATLNFTNAALEGVAPGDVVTLVTSNATGTFDSKNVGTGKAVTVSGLSLSGAAASNYILVQPTTTADITPAQLTVTATGQDKLYDATTTATVTLADNRVAGDLLSDADTSASFADKNVGGGKTVGVSSISISGADAGNYVLQNITASTTANITAAPLTVSATGVDRVYDAGIDATVTLSDNHLGSDIVTDSYTGASFADKNVGTAKPVSVSGITISGADAGNYTVNGTATATATIGAKALTATITADDKVYDGTTAAVDHATLGSGVIGSEDVSLVDGTAVFDSKDIGTRTVTDTGLSLTGADAGNYTVNGTATTTANITAKHLTVASITADDKTYDGTATANISASSLNGVVGTEDVSLTVGAENFDGTDVGLQLVTATGLGLTGTAASNYVLDTTSATTTANITAKHLTVASITADDKTYDGTATANISASSLNGVVGTEDVSLTVGAANFASANSGTQTVTATDLGLTGAAAGNYVLDTTSATTTAAITAKHLTATITADDKVYDGTTAAVDHATLGSGVIGSEDVSLVDGTAVFDSKDIGTRTVTDTGLSLTGADAGNYTVNGTATTTANITAKHLTVASITADDKTYDGTATANISASSLNGVVGTEDVSLTVGAANFASANSGTQTVTATDLGLTGAAAGNYVLDTTSATTTAAITAKHLTATITADDKVYDGTTAAVDHATLGSGVIGSEDVSLVDGTAVFDSKDIGTRTVTDTGLSLTGADAGNYTVNGTATTTANITAKHLTVASITADDKTYDGTATANISASSLNGVVGTEDVSLTVGAANFASANSGTQTVTATDLGLTGAAAGNYVLDTTSATTTAAILPPN